MNQPDIEEGATARLCAAMHEALRSAPAVSRGDAFPRAWWQHLGAQAGRCAFFDVGLVHQWNPNWRAARSRMTSSAPPPMALTLTSR